MRVPGICWKCGDRYQPGHPCKKLMTLTGEEEAVEVVEEAEEIEVGEELENQTEEVEQIQVSINALDGGITDATMKLRGNLNKKSILVAVPIVLWIIKKLNYL